MKATGTSAKKIALYFIGRTKGRATPDIIKRMIAQAKNLLSYGYTEHEIISVIDYLVDVKKVEMYSLGYINTCINTVLQDIAKEHLKEERLVAEKEVIRQQREKGETLDESTERNRAKSNRLGVQRGFGEKYSFDLFERPRQDN